MVEEVEEDKDPHTTLKCLLSEWQQNKEITGERVYLISGLCTP